jgi:hypothetical protein
MHSSFERSPARMASAVDKIGAKRVWGRDRRTNGLDGSEGGDRWENDRIEDGVENLGSRTGLRTGP